ncbi:TetR/AcrR family transcriptional regulator [Microbacterium gorillae]|uniref:TetR/AcrR family transcriptional regulator n=1 Tax=Microbacterium gorillae TaxID=1231063 RepID=UPI0006935B50|nr:TetR/AcrR family transcriptional regulator [Microbacterium gorillae]
MSTTVDPAAPRVRPRDRKQRIEEAAALAFARQGYHAVGMQDIAAAVGISAPALYRHFPNKYALFARTAFVLAHRLIEDSDAAAALPIGTPAQARAALEALLDAAISTTIELRATGGIYRWEARYLNPQDRRRMRGEFDALRERFARAHRVARPEVSEADRRFLVLGALSVAAGITSHRTVLAVRPLRTLLREAAWRVLDSEPAVTDTTAPVPAPADQPVDAGRRVRLAEAAVRLFAKRGYNEVTIEDLALEVDLTPSGVYRHYDGKAALLLAACERAAAELDGSVRAARATAPDPVTELRALCRAYIDYTFAHLGLMRVYFSEIGNLGPDEQRRLRAVQRAHVDEWVELLRAVRPELPEREATVLVHAGLNVVSDQAPLLADRDAAAASRLARLVETVLGIR